MKKHDRHDHRSVSCLHCLFPAVTSSLIVLQGSKLLQFGIVVLGCALRSLPFCIDALQGFVSGYADPLSCCACPADCCDPVLLVAWFIGLLDALYDWRGLVFFAGVALRCPFFGTIFAGLCSWLL